MVELARAYLAPAPTADAGPGFNVATAATAGNPEPPAELAPLPFAARLYLMLAPLAQYDPSYGWSLLTFVNAAVLAFEQVEAMVRDTEAGPGWSPLMDVERCPPEALGWLGQFVGVRLLPSAGDETRRERIAATDGFHRGTPAALIAAAQATLTGNRTVFLTERSGNPANHPEYAYELRVSTYRGQTPDPGATQRALIAQKPGALVLTYVCVVGQVYDQVRTRFATYAALRAGYPNYLAVWQDTPP